MDLNTFEKNYLNQVSETSSWLVFGTSTFLGDRVFRTLASTEYTGVVYKENKHFIS